MNRIFRLGLVAAFLVVMFTTLNAAQAASYEIDSDHSNVSFKIRHLVSKTQGHFEKFNGVIDYNAEKPEKSTVTATIDVKSLNTGVEKRDEHLKGKDFFNVEKNPTMKFQTVKLTKVTSDGKKGELVGKLTMNGVTKPVILNVEMTGKTKDPFSGKEKVGFSGSTKINRQDFGITWNLDDKQGGTVLGDDVDIDLNIEAVSKS